MHQQGPYQPQQKQSEEQSEEPPRPRPGWFARHTLLITFGAAWAVLAAISVLTGGEENAGSTGALPAERAADGGPRPEAGKRDGYGDGEYLVGEDIPPGTYTSAGADTGAARFCSITTEPPGDIRLPQFRSGDEGQRLVITLAPDDGVVTVRGCEPLTLRR